MASLRMLVSQTDFVILVCDYLVKAHISSDLFTLLLYKFERVLQDKEVVYHGKGVWQ